jgi:predicted transcriptional regulator
MFPGLNINAIALQIGQTQANISTQVKNLETANLVQVIFKMGRHGVSKTISLKHRDIIINLREVKQ